MAITKSWRSTWTRLLLGIFAAVFFCLLFPSLPAAVSPPDAGARMGIVRLDANADGAHTCAVKEDSTVICWGSDSNGQLGDGKTTNSPTPVKVASFDGAISVAAGNLHTCALHWDGHVLCWGGNGNGQLGVGTTTPSLKPVTVFVLNSAIAVAAGDLTTCAVRVDGTAWCWGSNSNGQIGDGTLQDKLVPVQVPGISNAVSVAVGATHSCALIADGTARCWGGNAQGQVGDGTTAQRPLPVTVSGLSNAVALSTGGNHTCAVRSDGTVLCWGSNTKGQIGDGTTTNRPSPTRVNGITTAVSVAAGSAGTCVQLASGVVMCHGNNNLGQTGDGTTITPRLTPVAVVNLSGVAAVAAGNDFACAITTKETIECWGNNGIGDLGDGSTSPSFSPTPLAVSGAGGSIGARGITGGGFHTCARRASSIEACWGDDSNGQLGNDDPTFTATSLPVAVEMLFSNGLKTFLVNLAGVKSIANGEFHSCETGGGLVQCWGWNGHGQLGIGSTSQSLLPAIVPGLTNVTSIAAGSAHTCVVIPTLTGSGGGTVACWGSNSSGQLGNGHTGTDVLSPAPVLAGVFVGGFLTSFPLTNITALAAGDAHTCALTGDGHVLCWGNNAHGQLGGTTASSSNLPVLVSGVTNAIAITAGALHSCALLAGGAMKCWGANGSGQLGDTTATDRSTPVFVITTGLEGFVALNNIVAIGAGAMHTCALTVFGNVFCWGDNTFGQLGTVTNGGSALFPVSDVSELLDLEVGITTMKTAIALGVGRFHNCVIEVDGEPVCWGANSFGQIGNGNFTNSSFGQHVPSFLFNIDPNVTLGGNGQVAQINALVNCPAGREVHLTVTLTQDTISGQGRATGMCTGGLASYPVNVPSTGPGGFKSGSALATADAEVKDRGTTQETEHWQRAVTIQDQ